SDIFKLINNGAGMTRNQKGFGAIEGLLFLILLSILGFTGYYVWHTSKNANSTYNTAAKTSSGTPTTPGSSDRFKLGFYNASFILPPELKGMTISQMTGTPCTPNTACRVFYALRHPDFTEANNKCYG